MNVHSLGTGAEAMDVRRIERGGGVADTGAMRRSLPLALVLLAAVPAGASAAWFSFAPYTDLAGWPPPKLTAMQRGGGIDRVTLGFVVAEGGTQCTPAWGGYATYPGAGAKAYRRKQVAAFRRAGGDVVVSFGGAAGSELASVCTTPGALAAAYGSVLDAYDADHADFDIEGAAVADPVSNKRRAQAIAMLQRERRDLRVAYTLPVLPAGLDVNGRATVRAARRGGVRLDLVNVMAMDYGDSAAPDPDGRMGAYAIRAAKSTARQLGWSLRRIGVTPMIGINDVQTEVFTLADARRLAAWARAHHLGSLSMWQTGRDVQCKQPTTSTSIDCSGVAQRPWAFARALG